MTSIIPIVFAFDDRYALPASIAISSLLKSKHTGTEYKIIILDGGLSKKNINAINKLSPNIIWKKVNNNTLNNVPTSEKWPLSVYYRLLIADLLKEYDKIIWSDVDVLFCGDLTEIYKINLEDCDWAGVAAERQDEINGVHIHFAANKKPYICMTGFMVINAKQWRSKKMFSRFLQIINSYGPDLKMFDLDVLNLASDKILNVPFNYCVLENIYNSPIKQAPEYPWLSNVYTDIELERAKISPIIIHFAGKSPKVWKRPYLEIPAQYFSYIKNSPFYNEEYYFPKWTTYTKSFFLMLCIKLMPIKRIRKRLKEMRKNLYNI